GPRRGPAVLVAGLGGGRGDVRKVARRVRTGTVRPPSGSRTSGAGRAGATRTQSDRGGCVDRNPRAPAEALPRAPCRPRPGRRRTRERPGRGRRGRGGTGPRGGRTDARAGRTGRGREAEAPAARARVRPGGEAPQAHPLLGGVGARR